jgi:hypothetical protein
VFIFKAIKTRQKVRKDSRRYDEVEEEKRPKKE